MNMKRCSVAVLVTIIILLSSCQTVPVSKASKVVEPDSSYVVVRFQGPKADIVLRELNDRSRIVLALKNTDKLQVVPVPPGEYAIRRISGDRPFIESLFLGSAKYYIAVPYEIMRVISVRPGESVYIGEFDIRKTIDLNPMTDGVVRYLYDPASAKAEYENLYGTNHRSRYVGFAD